MFMVLDQRMMALDELKLAQLWVVFPGKESYSLAKNVRVIPLAELAQIEG